MPDPNRKTPLFRASDLLPALAGLAVGTVGGEYADIPQVALGVANRRVDDRYRSGIVDARLARQATLDAQDQARAQELGKWLAGVEGADQNDPLYQLARRSFDAGDYERGSVLAGQWAGAASRAGKQSDVVDFRDVKDADGATWRIQTNAAGQEINRTKLFEGPKPETETYRHVTTNPDGSQIINVYKVDPATGQHELIDTETPRGPGRAQTAAERKAQNDPFGGLNESEIRMALTAKVAGVQLPTGVKWIDDLNPQQAITFLKNLGYAGKDPELLEPPAAPAAPPTSPTGKPAVPAASAPTGTTAATSPAPTVASPAAGAAGAPRDPGAGLARGHASSKRASAPAAKENNLAPVGTVLTNKITGERVRKDASGNWVPF